MRIGRQGVGLAAILALTAFHGAAPGAVAAEIALSGQVTAPGEGNLEGVVVTAKKDGGTVSISVITNKEGRYAFPANRLEPGSYAFTVRAAGFELAAPAKASVASESSSTADLKLRGTKRLSSQLTNTEWLMSMPGSEEDKAPLLNCNGCHTYERIARSTHDAEEWTQVITRMQGYAPVSQPIKPQLFPDQARAASPEQNRKFAEYLARVNLSDVPQWEYPLKVLPRPSGRDTHVVITEYQLPRPTIEPHDVIVDAQGAVWYSDFGEPFISKFDPKTLKLTEYPLKEQKKGFPEGNLSLAEDKHGKLWFDMMFQGALGSLDPKTEQISYFPVPPQYNNLGLQLNFIGLNYDVDGKVWTKDVGSRNIFRLDLKTGNWEKFEPVKAIPASGRFGIYQVISDSGNNLWMAEFSDGWIGRLDAKTGEAKWWKVPTPNARARRLNIDAEDRLWFAEYRGNKIAMFDTKVEKFSEWQIPIPWFNPYRVAADKNGELWASTENADRIMRLNPKTGEAVSYLMPADTNMRSIFIDELTTPVTVWVGSNHGAALVKIEPLD